MSRVECKNEFSERRFHAVNEEKFAQLIEGIPVDLKSDEGNTVLHLAVSKGFARTSKRLVRNGADVNSKNRRNGNRPIHLAAKTGCTATVKLLIANGADVKAANKRGNHPLHLAQTLLTAKLLIQAGAEVTTRNQRNGNTPLHLVRSVPTAKMLVQAGAEVNARNDRKETPLHLALELPLYPALEDDKVQLAIFLVEQHADVNATTSSNTTPLCLAASMNSTAVTTILLEKGATATVNLPDLKEGQVTTGWTPLHWAAHHDNVKIVTMLLDSGADPRLKTSEGKTALILAAQSSQALRLMRNTKVRLDRDQPMVYRVGDRVRALYKGSRGNPCWYHATVIRVRGDHRYEVSWDDGDNQDRVKNANDLEHLTAEEVQKVDGSKAFYAVGDRVRAQCEVGRGGAWFRATITEVLQHGSRYRVKWNRDDKDRWMIPGRVPGITVMWTENLRPEEDAPRPKRRKRVVPVESDDSDIFRATSMDDYWF